MVEENTARHPLGIRAKVLLSSVFGPYAVDDEYGSRAINPMELYHNQVTREQGPFSMRMFHRSFGLLFIQENLDAPCTLLDFPSRERFIQELRSKPCDIVGISGILSTAEKVRDMCELVRRYAPKAVIVVGGHLTSLPELETMIQADFIVRGDGIRWFQEYLGQDTRARVKHPAAYSGFGARMLGVQSNPRTDVKTGVLVPAVGCPMGCNFCSTSHFFGGKGKSVQFYKTGEELFEVMCELEKKLDVQAFFVLDENFLFYRKRTLALLELMERHGKSWAFFIFSSADLIRSYSVDELVRLGVRWVWIGLEGRDSAYAKLHGRNTHDLVRELQAHGISVMGSSIIGLDEHTPANLPDAIDWAVSHDSDFHQFMLYTALPGTPLYRQRAGEGTLYPPDEMAYADAHGQSRFNYRHAHIRNGAEEKILADAFRRDFEVNGPSLARLIRTMLAGWKRYKDCPDPRVRERFLRECACLPFPHTGVIWALKKWYRKDRALHAMMSGILNDLYAEFGWKARLTAPWVGRFLCFTMAREARRLQQGFAYEPVTFCESKPGPADEKPCPENGQEDKAPATGRPEFASLNS